MSHHYLTSCLWTWAQWTLIGYISIQPLTSRKVRLLLPWPCSFYSDIFRTKKMLPYLIQNISWFMYISRSTYIFQGKIDLSNNFANIGVKIIGLSLFFTWKNIFWEFALIFLRSSLSISLSIYLSLCSGSDQGKKNLQWR